jgi:hypothetical protein
LDVVHLWHVHGGDASAAVDVDDVVVGAGDFAATFAAAVDDEFAADEPNTESSATTEVVVEVAKSSAAATVAATDVEKGFKLL